MKSYSYSQVDDQTRLTLIDMEKVGKSFDT